MHKTDRVKRRYELLHRTFQYLCKMWTLHRRGCNVVHEMSDFRGERGKIFIVEILFVILVFFKRQGILLLHGETQHLHK